MDNRIYIGLADCATDALYTELNTSPKVGLVTPYTLGAHKDMDYHLMCRAISSLYGGFFELAQSAYTAESLDIVAKRAKVIGCKAEEEMFKQTKGVNCYKGSLYSLGLLVTAVSYVNATSGDTSLKNICDAISRIVCFFEPVKGTKGSKITKEFGIKGAFELSQEGFYPLLSDTLGFYSAQKCDSNRACVKTLLYICTFLDDTNVLSRGGKDAGSWIKQRASEVLQNFSIAEVEQFNDEAVQKNLSVGGCADVLALTILADRLIQKGYISTSAVNE